MALLNNFLNVKIPYIVVFACRKRSIHIKIYEPNIL